jgi:peptide/nickel transport system permease protein
LKEDINTGKSYSEIVKTQFRKNKRALWSLRVIVFMALIALFADFIANEKPIVMKYEDKVYFPLIKSYGVDLGISKWDAKMLNVNWVTFPAQWAVRPLIPYSPTTQDFRNAQYKGPFEKQNVESWRWRHWLGTEKLGRDVLSSLVHGTRIAFLVGILSMSLATFIGILLGSLAGFLGDEKVKISRAKLFLYPIFLGAAVFYSGALKSYFLPETLNASFALSIIKFLFPIFLFFIILIAGHLFSKGFEKLSWFDKKVNLPIDILVSRLIEIIVSIPKLFLVIAIVAVFKPSIFLVMAVIGLTSWTGIARFIRAELLRIKNLEYVEAAYSLGFSHFRIMFKHAVPNALSPVFISVAFGIAAAVLVEAFLSFIGIGIPPEVLTWGKLLSFARSAPTAWWLAVFPGLAIFITVTLFNLIGEGLSDALDPRLKQ